MQAWAFAKPNLLDSNQAAVEPCSHGPFVMLQKCFVTSHLLASWAGTFRAAEWFQNAGLPASHPWHGDPCCVQPLIQDTVHRIAPALA